MAVNYDGRCEVRIFYSVGESPLAILNHRHTIDVAVEDIGEVEPGQTFEGVATDWHDGSSGHTLADDVDAYVALLVNVMNDDAATINRAELWRYGAEPSVDATFIAAYEIALPGEIAAAWFVAGQYTHTFRTAGGGIMRLQIMETPTSDTFSQIEPPYVAGFNADVASYLTSNAHPWVGRDNTKPIASIRVSYSQNEKLFRKRFRNG